MCVCVCVYVCVCVCVFEAGEHKGRGSHGSVMVTALPCQRQ